MQIATPGPDWCPTPCLPTLFSSTWLLVLLRGCLCMTEEGCSWCCPSLISRPCKGCRVLVAPLDASQGLGVGNPLHAAIPWSTAEHVYPGANHLSNDKLFQIKSVCFFFNSVWMILLINVPNCKLKQLLHTFLRATKMFKHMITCCNLHLQRAWILKAIIYIFHLYIRITSFENSLILKAIIHLFN